MTDLSWSAVIPRPQTEKRTAAKLCELGFSAFVPMHTFVRRAHRTTKKVRQVELPAMPGYVFVGTQLGQNRWPEIKGVDTVVRALSFNGHPVTIAQRDIDRCREIETEHTPHVNSVATHRAFRKGDRVCVPAWDRHAIVVALVKGDKAKVKLDQPLLGGIDTLDMPLENIEAA